MRRSSLLCSLWLACQTSPQTLGESATLDQRKQAATSIPEGTLEALAVLRLAGEARADELQSFGLGERASVNIQQYRVGDDDIAFTADDERFDTLAELDAIPFVRGADLDLLLRKAIALGYTNAGSNPTSGWSDTARQGAPPAMSTWDSQTCVVGFGEQVFVVNGIGQSRIFQPRSNTWSAAAKTDLVTWNQARRFCVTNQSDVVVASETERFNSQSNQFLMSLYDAAQRAWIDLPPTPSKHSLATAAFVMRGRTIVAFNHSAATLHIAELDLDQTPLSWRQTRQADLLGNQVLLGAVTAGDEVYVWTGNDGYVYRKNTQLTRLPNLAGSSRNGVGLTFINGRLFSWPSRQVFDPATQAWQPFTLVGAPSLSGCNAAAFSDGGFVYVLGRMEHSSSYVRCDDAGRWDPRTDTWSSLDKPGIGSSNDYLPAFAAGHLLLWDVDGQQGRYRQVP